MRKNQFNTPKRESALLVERRFHDSRHSTWTGHTSTVVGFQLLLVRVRMAKAVAVQYKRI